MLCDSSCCLYVCCGLWILQLQAENRDVIFPLGHSGSAVRVSTANCLAQDWDWNPVYRAWKHLLSLLHYYREFIKHWEERPSDAKCPTYTYSHCWENEDGDSESVVYMFFTREQETKREKCKYFLPSGGSREVVKTHLLRVTLMLQANFTNVVMTDISKQWKLKVHWKSTYCSWVFMMLLIAETLQRFCDALKLLHLMPLNCRMLKELKLYQTWIDSIIKSGGSFHSCFVILGLEYLSCSKVGFSLLEMEAGGPSEVLRALLQASPSYIYSFPCW